MDRRDTKLSALSPHQQKICSLRLSGLMRLLCTLILASVMSACAGGSGSSGFDASPAAENEAINQALLQRQCQPSEGFTICPANEDALNVPGHDATPAPEGTEVSTNPNAADFERCVEGGEQRCRITVQVNAAGLPAGAAYQLAGRGVEPLSTWRISEAAVTVADGDMVIFSAQVDVPSASAALQVAVLVFVDGAGTAVGEIGTLAETGATLGFVTGPTPIPR